jgi:hypothetical protein
LWLAAALPPESLGVALWDGQVQPEQIDKLYKHWASRSGNADDKLK